jgi:hypothetical protein
LKWSWPFFRFINLLSLSGLNLLEVALCVLSLGINILFGDVFINKKAGSCT